MPKPPARPAFLDMTLPVKGVHRGTPRHAVPDGYSPDCNNVTAYDAGGRARIGTRPGLSKYWNLQFAGGAYSCQLLHQCTIELSGTRTDYIIVVFGGKVYRMKPSDVSLQRIDGAGAATFSAGRRVEAATLYGITYFTDGLTLKKYNHLTTTFGNFTASGGSMPATATPRYCRLFAAWRGRLVQALLDDASPELVFFSKQTDPTDYDYGATPNAAMAVALNNNFRAGQIGQPVTALIPYNEDRLIIGLDHGIYEMRGDPADGGTLFPISENIGILTQDSWCLAGDALYFMGPSGFYRWAGEGEPQNLSQTVYGETYAGLPRVGYYVNLEYHQSRQEIWIFLTHNVTTYQTLHAVYDLRTGGLFPISYPADTGGDDGSADGMSLGAPTIGPTKTLYYDGGDATTNDSVLLVGCRDGYVRKVSEATANDDGAAVSSYVWSAPFCPAGPQARAMLNGWFPVLGEQAATNCDWLLQAGDTAYEAYAAPTNTKSGTFATSGRQAVQGHRMQFGTMFAKFSNSTVSKGFDLERVTFRVDPAGRTR